MSHALPLKAVLAAVAAIAIAIGFALPAPTNNQADARSQIQTLDLNGG
ncbi:hypothetical protein [Phenylobacterium sp.]